MNVDRSLQHDGALANGGIHQLVTGEGTAGLAELRRALAASGRLLVIERRVQPGATGLASHGWTEGQAESFAAQCQSAGFSRVRVDQYPDGRRVVWVVRAEKAR